MPQPAYHWEKAKRWFTGACLVGAILWIVTLVTEKEVSERLSRAGDALAAVASVAALVALVFAIRQLEQQQAEGLEQQRRMAHEHEVRAMEVVRAAYAEWLERAHRFLVDVEHLSDNLLLGTRVEDFGYSAIAGSARQLSEVLWRVKVLEPSATRFERFRQIHQELLAFRKSIWDRADVIEHTSQQQAIDLVDLGADLEKEVETRTAAVDSLADFLRGHFEQSLSG
jgi:hypothetical protein